jgi:hypothetical protein
MTIERLQMYKVVEAQIELYKRTYAYPSLAVDTTKPNVQSNSISDTTANTAIQKMEIDPYIKAEFKRLIDEKKALDDFIYSIDDELAKAIAIRRFIEKETYAEMSIELNYSSKHLKNVLTKYLNKRCDLL